MILVTRNPEVLTVKRPTDLNQQLPVHDYGTALQSAVSWLGDRYLLAAPVPARRPERYAEAGFELARRRHLRSMR